MNSKTTVNHFVEAIADNINQGKDGTMVIMGEDDGWGKAIIERGELVSIVYGIYRGQDALQQLIKLSSLRFMFRPAKATEPSTLGNRAYANAGSARISSEGFFSYFNFDFDFFRDGAAPLKASAGSANVINSSAHKKILVIDDSVIARKMASQILIVNGYEVVEARDGFDALGKLEQENPDLIILDLIMPGIDGYKVVDLLKKNKKYQNLPIILVTSKDSLMDKLKGKMSSSDAYITKPYDDRELLKIIDLLLQK